MGKGLRYLLAAKFTLPKEFVKTYSGQEPPAGDGTEFTMDPERYHEGKEEERKELIKPSLQPPHEGGEPEEDFLDKFSFIEEREELKKPSLQPPHEGGDPFIFDVDEPGEQGPLFDEVDEPGEQGPSQNSEVVTPGTTSFIGATKAQKDLFEEEDNSLYVPSDPEEDDRVEVQEEDERKGKPVVGDCEPPEAVVLLFAKALKDNSAVSVKRALQDIVLYLESFGLPVYRLHSDHGETFNHTIRSWLRDRGIRATWSEPGVPQGNGRAEAAVRWVKDQTRTLLMSSKLPTRLWPTAAEAAVAAQRARTLGLNSKLAAPYGSTVLIKQKAFDSGGPRRRDKVFESKWPKGVYVT